MFKIGDKVAIRRDSEYYGGGRHNPAEVMGEIVGANSNDMFSDHHIKVKWLKVSNVYREKDLRLWELSPVTEEDVL